MAHERIDIHQFSQFYSLTEPNFVGKRWKTWKRRFETYVAALGIMDNTQNRALLLYLAGEATLEIFDTLPDTGEANDYTRAMENLDAYFSPKRNTDYEIFKFCTVVQAVDEMLDQYTTPLRKLASTCDFTNLVQ